MFCEESRRDLAYCYSYVTIGFYYDLVSSDVNSYGYGKIKIATIATHFCHPTLKAKLEHIISICQACQCSKPGTGFGEPPTRNTLLLQWSQVAVDLIGLDIQLILNQTTNLILNQHTHPLKFPSINFHDIHLICFVKNPGDTWHIAIPTSLLDPIISWYHQMSAHVGMTRLNATISSHFLTLH